MKIEITKELVEHLNQEGFYSDTMLTQYFLLLSLYNKDSSIVEMLDDSFKAKRLAHQYYELLKKELVEKIDSEFTLTQKGKSLVEKFTGVPTVQTKISFAEWFNRWMDLWPKGVKTGGKLVRSDKEDCLKKMKAFIAKYKYPHKVIMTVTRQYIEDFEKQDYQFIKSATYFIDKRGEGSELAARCQDYKDKPEEPKTVYTTDLV